MARNKRLSVDSFQFEVEAVRLRELHHFGRNLQEQVPGLPIRDVVGFTCLQAQAVVQEIRLRGALRREDPTLIVMTGLEIVARVMPRESIEAGMLDPLVAEREQVRKARAWWEAWYPRTFAALDAARKREREGYTLEPEESQILNAFRMTSQVSADPKVLEEDIRRGMKLSGWELDEDELPLAELYLIDDERFWRALFVDNKGRLRVGKRQIRDNARSMVRRERRESGPRIDDIQELPGTESDASKRIEQLEVVTLVRQVIQARAARETGTRGSVLSLLEDLEVGRVSSSDVARQLRVAESTVRGIRREVRQVVLEEVERRLGLSA